MDREQVNHPAHYGGDVTYEAIKVIEAWELDFCLGNAIKYVCRVGSTLTFRADIESTQVAQKTIIDLQKAIWYLNRRLRQLNTLHLVEPLGVTVKRIPIDE